MGGKLGNVGVVRLLREAAGSASFDGTAEAEQSVLGALLLDNTAYYRVANVISADDFYRDDHRRIYRHLARLIERNEPADIVTVSESIDSSDDKDKTGGAAYLAALAQNTPSALNIRRYAELVREKSKRRALVALGAELQERAAHADLAELRREVTDRLAQTTAPEGTDAIQWDQLAGKEPPPRRWAVKGWLGFDHVTLLVGPGGIGKTLLAQQLASCLALGVSFIDEVPARQRVLFWACEDDHDELWRRQVAVARWLNEPIENFAGRLRIVPRHGRANTLFASEYGALRFTPVIEDLRIQASDAEVVILDNAAQLYGGDENSRHMVTEFLNALAGALSGKAILLLAHPSRAAGSEFSGSGAWDAVARTRLYLASQLPGEKPAADEPAADDQRFLSRRKANYSMKDWRRLTFRDGVLVPEEIDPRGGVVAEVRARQAERAVLEGLRTLISKGLTATDGTTSPRFLPRLLTEYKVADGQTKNELTEAMRRLILAGKLVRGVVGHRPNRAPIEGLTEVP